MLYLQIYLLKKFAHQIKQGFRIQTLVFICKRFSGKPTLCQGCAGKWNWSSLEGDGRLEGKGLHVMNLLLLLLPGKFRIVKMWSKNSCKNLSFDVRHWSHSAAVTESIFLIHNCDLYLFCLHISYFTFHICFLIHRKIVIYMFCVYTTHFIFHSHRVIFSLVAP